MNILIIGGAGFIGANLVRKCLQEPTNKVTVLDSLEPHLHSTVDNLRAVWDKIQFVRGSICDETLVAKMVQGKDVIFNCAAQTSHILSLRYPIFDAEINCLGNLKLLEAIRLLNKDAVVVFTSSSTVIGKAVGDIVDETHGEKPLDIYSANKGVAEKYYYIYNHFYDLKTVVLRFANLYGPYGKGIPDFGFINYFIHLANASQEIKIFGSGQQTRNVLFVEDACDIIYQAAQDEDLYGDVFFATHDEHLSVLSIAQQIIDVFKTGKLVHINWPDERKRIEIEKVQISSARLREITGWYPRYSFKEGLIKTKNITKGIS